MKTSWEKVAPWYNKAVGEAGNYYHQHVLIPNSLKLLNLKTGDSLLDVGCGNGVLARAIPKDIDYLGVDASPSLIKDANDKNPKHKYLVANAEAPFAKDQKFSHAVLILSLQNMRHPDLVIKNINADKLLIVLNHPMFRIPRQTSWVTDEKNNTEFRRVNRYLTPLEIPITAHPGQKNSEVTWSFHYSLSDYSKYLQEAGFTIRLIEEWTTDKKITWVQSEFPLFMALLAKKL